MKATVSPISDTCPWCLPVLAVANAADSLRIKIYRILSKRPILKQSVRRTTKTAIVPGLVGVIDEADDSVRFGAKVYMVSC